MGHEVDPPENRVNLKGQRICRWCSRKLEEHTYVPLGQRKRRCALLCPKCDSGKISWLEEFDYVEPDGA